MVEDDPVAKALEKLDWIGKLSKRSFPDGGPKEPEEIRDLLNRIVLDVRAALRLLEGTREEGESDESDGKERLDPYGIGEAAPEVAANTLICVINQATYLLRRQVQRQERDFLEEGGFTERLYRVRKEWRGRQATKPKQVEIRSGEVDSSQGL